jgi:hypothetical protein
MHSKTDARRTTTDRKSPTSDRLHGIRHGAVVRPRLGEQVGERPQRLRETRLRPVCRRSTARRTWFRDTVTSKGSDVAECCPDHVVRSTLSA